MVETRIIMGMPVTVEVVDKISVKDFDDIFKYFVSIDKRFSTYKKNSEISKVNRNEIQPNDYSIRMKEVLQKCEETKKMTQGYFDIRKNNKIDPSGLVKGWAIFNAANILRERGYSNFYVDAGGDIEVSGRNSENQKWRVGIRNPFNRKENVKVLGLTNVGIATSGTAIRGQHIYNPKNDHDITDIVSLTVIGKNIYEADRFATAAFAMEREGINFLYQLGFEAYMIDNKGIATYTSGFEKYVL